MNKQRINLHKTLQLVTICLICFTLLGNTSDGFAGLAACFGFLAGTCGLFAYLTKGQ